MRLLLKSLGPGVITGAADDDPSGIATYSVAGAQLGTKLLWTALLTWPLMAAVQLMCARLGMVTGRGLASAIRQRYPSLEVYGKRAARMREAGPSILAQAEAQRRAASPAIGRNQPCPCGSGKKYKRCCIGKTAQPPTI